MSTKIKKKSAITQDVVDYPFSDHPNDQPTDKQAITQKAVNYPVSDHPNPEADSDQSNTGYQQQKPSVASFNEQLNPANRMQLITDANASQNEAAQKLARAKEVSDKIIESALDIPRKRKGEPKQ